MKIMYCAIWNKLCVCRLYKLCLNWMNVTHGWYWKTDFPNRCGVQFYRFLPIRLQRIVWLLCHGIWQFWNIVVTFQFFSYDSIEKSKFWFGASVTTWWRMRRIKISTFRSHRDQKIEIIKFKLESSAFQLCFCLRWSIRICKYFPTIATLFTICRHKLDVCTGADTCIFHDFCPHPLT